MSALSRSTQFDWRLAPYDIAGSKAHARALHRAALLTENELAEMIAGLDQLASEVASGAFRPAETDEDVHGALERRLIEVLGRDLGGRIRAGRSRNDQIATLIRLYLREALHRLTDGVHEVIRALSDQARSHLGEPMPGRTHLQHTPSRCCSRTICWLTPGPWYAIAIAFVISIGGSTSARTAQPRWPVPRWGWTPRRSLLILDFPPALPIRSTPRRLVILLLKRHTSALKLRWTCPGWART